MAGMSPEKGVQCGKKNIPKVFDLLENLDFSFKKNL